MNKLLHFAFTLIALLTTNVWTVVNTQPQVPICQPITHINNAVNIFPRSPQQITTWTSTIKDTTQKALKDMLAIPAKKRTFDNTLRAFDRIKGNINAFLYLITLMIKVSPDKNIREASQKANNSIAPLLIDIEGNKALYQAIQDYYVHLGSHEQLKLEERYFLEETIKNFKQNGAHLDARQFSTITKLRNKADAQTTLSINKQLERALSIPKAHLISLSQQILKKLPEKNNTYQVTLNPQNFDQLITYRSIMALCTVEQTRKDLFYALNTHKPSNIDMALKTFAQDKNNLAKQLGYQNFAAQELASTMAKTPQRAITFLETTIQQCVKSGQEELALLKRHLPTTITLDKQGNLTPWDYEYVRQMYISNTFNVHDKTIAEYLHLDTTLKNMFSVFGTFFGLTFTEVTPFWRWHETVRMVEVHETSSKKCLGYIYCDLFSREAKITNNCSLSLVNAVNTSTGSSQSVGIVITNFNPIDHANKLIEHYQVISLFHEFGHAIHALLARPTLASHGALFSKPDFLEFPSQLFEQWASHESILPIISSHHKTKQSLSTEMVNNIIRVRKFAAWKNLLFRCMRSLFTLILFTDTEKYTDPYQLWDALQKKYIPDECLRMPLFWYYATHNVAYDAVYGPKHYGYAWSHHYATEIFDIIKNAGILNPAMGNKLRNDIFAHGSGSDPEKLLHSFLGR